jgi:hypothetical protein
MSQEIEQANSRKTDANGQPQKSHSEFVEIYCPKRWMPVLFVVGLLTVGAVGVWFILWASQLFTDPTAALTFIMGSIISLFLLLSTIATTCIYWGQRNIMLQQWRAMRAQLSAMEQQAEYAQRAYVCVPAGNIQIVHQLPASTERVAVFNLRVENFGNTPANDVRIHSFAEIVTDVPDPAMKVTGKEPSRIGLIAPHAHTEHWIRTPELSREDDQRWVNGEIEICCGGVITYSTFGETRTTKFCLLQRVRSASVEPYGKWSEAD